MSRRWDWPQELKQHVLGNFRTPRYERSHERKPLSWRSKRTGMDPQHLVNIRSLPCAVCPENRDIEAHHLKSSGARAERGISLKATDRWAVPLCRWAHHAEVERIGSRQERDWFLSFGIDPEALAQGLWNARGDPVKMAFVVRAHKQNALRQLAALYRGLAHGTVDLAPGQRRRE